MSSDTILLIRRLYNEIAQFPNDLTKIKQTFSGTAFFPGGDGVCKEKVESLSNHKPIIVVGNTFDSLDNYNNSCLDKSENLNCPTWRNLVYLIKGSGIPLQDIYFTNVYPGLIHSKSNIGNYKPKDKVHDFIFYNFLIQQISLIEPHAVLFLGLNSFKFLTRHCSKLKKITSLKEADRKSLSFGMGLQLNEELKTFNWAIVNHPCYSHINSPKRSVLNKNGLESEIELIKKIYI